MKKINQDDLYQNLSEFLKTKGIELTEGSYTNQIRRGCTLLTDAINLSQAGIKQAKTKIDKKLDQMRQVIHERTAPKPPYTAAQSGNPPAEGEEAPSEAGAKDSSTRTNRKAAKERADQK